MRKKILLATFAALTLSIGATAWAATADTAKEIASKTMPTSATFSHVKDDGKEYEVYFQDNNQQVKYKVEVNKLTDKVDEVSIKNLADRGGNQNSISETDVRNIIAKDFPDAQIHKVELDNDHGLYKYEVKFSAKGIAQGEYEINAENGNIIEKSLKY